MLRDGVGGAKDQVRGTNDIAAVAPEIAWARFQLAVSYERGLGVSADRERAIQEYELASKAGYAGAKERLRALGR
jgi:TPR repeat protein